MTRSRVLLITPACQGADGLSAYSRLCIDALASVADLEVCSLGESDDRDRPLPSGVHSFFAGGRKSRLALRGLRRTLNPPDLVFCTHVNVAPVAVPMTYFGATLVVSLLGVEAWRPLRPRERFAVRRANLLVAISQHTINGFRAANPALATAPAEVCHLCLPNDPPSDAESARAEGSPDEPPANHPYALIVARMASEERYKGHDLLLEIWPEVLHAVPTARLLIAGGGDDRPRLVSKRDALGLQHAVEFLGRVVDQELGRLYERCAFFVMPSRHEGFGLVFLEAMRAGKPCIGAVGAASEIIEHEQTGFVFDSIDRAAIHDACIKLFTDPELAARLGESGRRRERDVFSRSAFRSRLLKLLKLAT